MVRFRTPGAPFLCVRRYEFLLDAVFKNAILKETMFDPKSIDDLAQRLTDAMPPAFQHLRTDMEKNFHAILQSTFTKMNLVGREEFDVQSAVLARTREKLEALEKQVALLEEKVLNK